MSDGVDVVLLGVLGTWTLVTGTLAIEAWKAKRDRLLKSAEFVLDWAEEYDSSLMRSMRAKLSEDLLLKADSVDYNVMDFFEHVGLFTRLGIVKPILAWTIFSGPAMKYYVALRRMGHDYFRNYRDSDPLALEEYEWLFEKLVKIECRKIKQGREDAEPSLSEVNTFLEAEKAIGGVRPVSPTIHPADPAPTAVSQTGA